MAVLPDNRAACAGLCAAAFALGLAAPAAAAPPQILALLATDRPVPLACADGACGAEFTTFCLESFRESPGWGSAYVPAEGSDLTLVLSDADGATRTLAAVPYIAVDSARTYVAVRISVPERYLAEWGAASVALAVGPVASLVPATLGDAETPITADELGETTGPVREHAERIFNEDADAVAVAAAAQKLENARQREPELDLSSLWDAFGGAPGPGSPEALRRLAQELNACLAEGRTLAFCIQSAHETTVTTQNRRVWQRLGTGM